MDEELKIHLFYWPDSHPRGWTVREWLMEWAALHDFDGHQFGWIAGDSRDESMALGKRLRAAAIEAEEQPQGEAA